ncbi:hypothetical protein P8A22_36260 [Streptomyces laculatispora]|uniref:Uncharacterized protein n=1 Tax=Streptomyces laculatispora TaxID=887464 RepID=A0ABY9IDB3_9ACTN|nr:hypothetical protein [Streptomyces laculatispora]WLQ44872.1 hypothetical protein P8A22_36260 [Streptomyces laculatispora]
MTAKEEAQALAEFHAEMDAEAEQTEEAPEAIANDTAAASDDNWEDMTKRPNEWIQIVNRQDIPDRAVRVAVALASFGGGGNTKDVFPTIDTLTEMVPRQRRTVAEGVADLRKADLIREQSRVFNGPVTYKLGTTRNQGGSQ